MSGSPPPIVPSFRPHDHDSPLHSSNPASSIEPPDPSPRIIQILPADRSARRACVRLSDATELEVATEVVERSGLGPGDPLDAAARAMLVDGDLRWRAREAALTLLDARQRTRRELGDRLRRKRYPRAVIEPTLDALEASGLVDDAEFARAFVRDRLRLKPQGRRRLLADLAARGVAFPVAEAAVAEVFDRQDVDETALARDIGFAWLRRAGERRRAALVEPPGSPERRKALASLLSYLGRRGLSGDTASAAVDAVMASLTEP